VICVVLPDPVYPITINTLLARTAYINYFLYAKIGRLVFWSLLETIDFLCGRCGSASGKSSNT
jgi:hypothetical protein